MIVKKLKLIFYVNDDIIISIANAIIILKGGSCMNFREELNKVIDEKKRIKKLAEIFLGDLIIKLREIPEDKFLAMTKLSFEKGNAYICIGSDSDTTAYIEEKQFNENIEQVFEYLRKMLKKEEFAFSENENEIYFEIEI